MKVIGIIPARYGSTRLEGKPLKDICGKPMIQLVYEAAQKARLLDQVYVATDDQRIVDAVEQFGGRRASPRPATTRAPIGSRKWPPVWTWTSWSMCREMNRCSTRR